MSLQTCYVGHSLYLTSLQALTGSSHKQRLHPSRAHDIVNVRAKRVHCKPSPGLAVSAKLYTAQISWHLHAPFPVSAKARTLAAPRGRAGDKRKPQCTVQAGPFWQCDPLKWPVCVDPINVCITEIPSLFGLRGCTMQTESHFRQTSGQNKINDGG